MRHEAKAVLNEELVWLRNLKIATTILFVLVTLTALIAVPAFWYVYGYTWLDWTLCLVLYIVSGLGITVGYHRLIAHGSFHCPVLVKAVIAAEAVMIQGKAT